MRIICCVTVLLCVSVGTAQEKPDPVVECSDIPGELVVCFTSRDQPGNLDRVLVDWQPRQVGRALAAATRTRLLSWRRPREQHFTNVVLLHFDERIDHAMLIAELTTHDDVKWAEPNRVCTGDVKDLVPNDPSYGTQYHHPLMQNDLAWDTTLGNPGIIIAITDDGVDLDHDDLAANIWVNPAEIAGNGIDDDGNGYIDDVNGWDFASGNANPNPNSSNQHHGTHVAGIAAARTNNGIGVAGTAGHATIMPVQFYDSALPGNWTAAVIAESFAYAADNGARIVTTSYNIDGWVNNATVHAAFTYLHDNGVLHFNSAGNGSTLNPPRQVFGQTFLTANTNASDVKSSSSNYGTGIDLCAPGSSIYATINNNSYSTFSGTSMAAPNAAGVAALIWSANPGWTREQVTAQLLAQADNIDAQNPSHVGLLGAGRANSYQALTQPPNLTPPRIVSSSIDDMGSTRTLESITVEFDQVMQVAPLNDPNAFEMWYAGPDHMFGTGDDEPVLGMSQEYFVGSNGIVDVQLTPGLAEGVYFFAARSIQCQSAFGTWLDGNGDNTAGDDWQITFVYGFDCNGNLVPDADDIAVGSSQDVNGNSVPDECECIGDSNLDGVVNVTDLLALLADWGPTTGSSDINADGAVNVQDLLLLLAAWGGCS